MYYLTRAGRKLLNETIIKSRKKNLRKLREYKPKSGRVLIMPRGAFGGGSQEGGSGLY